MRIVLITDEPVEELAAEPDTLAVLTAEMLAAIPPAKPRPIHVALCDDTALVTDPAVPPGTIHLRPQGSTW